MIKNTIDLLVLGDYYGETELIDIAKGKWETPTTWKGFFKWIKRLIHGRKSRSRN
jgi:hypothetical protein